MEDLIFNRSRHRPGRLVMLPHLFINTWKAARHMACPGAHRMHVILRPAAIHVKQVHMLQWKGVVNLQIIVVMLLTCASCGMNGYLSLCNGDPCPLIFRSPVTGMEDIMNNQLLCAIYKLPDFHKHITRPPAGVIFPKKCVTLGDLKPALVLWHEDSGRRPWESGRH